MFSIIKVKGSFISFKVLSDVILYIGLRNRGDNLLDLIGSKISDVILGVIIESNICIIFFFIYFIIYVRS